MNDSFFLGINDETLEDFGMRMPEKIKESYPIHRLLLANLLNYGFQTVCINVLVTMVVGFMVEAPMGPFRMCIFYLITAMGGSLFGCMTTPLQNAVGSEPIMFGLFAGLLGLCAVYWDKLPGNLSYRMCMVFLVVLCMILAILYLNTLA